MEGLIRSRYASMHVWHKECLPEVHELSSMMQSFKSDIRSKQVAGLSCNSFFFTSTPHTCSMSQQVSQEKLQQQLSHARAASKASDHSRAQAEAQHQAELADLHQQLNAAQQGCADLQTQRQQSLQLASAAAAATDAHHQEVETLKDRYTACCHQQAVAVERLDQEVAQLVQEAEHTMTTVAQKVSALHGASCSSQAELRQQLQQLRAEVAELQKGSSSTGMGESLMQQSGLVEALIQVRQQLDAVGCADMGTLLRQHQQLSTQVISCNTTCRCHHKCHDGHVLF